MRHSVKLATAVFMFLAGSALAETSIDLPIPEARALATQAALGGEPETARRIAAALLQADPNDRAALLVLAAVEPQLGRPTQGRLAGARAYAVSVTNAEKYEAARLTALAAANEGRFTLAQWWLRRALTVAPTPADAAQTMTDARGLRNLNPWSSNVALSFAPSDNVNGGSESQVYTIDGLPSGPLGPGALSADAQALSGWAGILDLSTSYRLNASPTYQTTVTARAYGRGVLLSQDAQAALNAEQSDAKASDFSTALLEFGLRHDRAATNGTYGFELTVGQVWSQTEFDYSFLRLGANRRFPIGERTQLSFAASAERRWNDSYDPEQWRRNIQGSWSRTGANGNVLSATLSYSNVLALAVPKVGTIEIGQETYGFIYYQANTNDNAVSTTVQVRYQLAKPVGPAQLDFSIGLQEQHFRDYVFVQVVPGGREDLRVFASVNAFFPDYSYAGFAPVVTLSASRTDSNVSRFDTNDLSLSFTFRSTF